MKTLGLDLGSNSIGWSIRNTDIQSEIGSQIEKFGVITFEKGVGEGKSGEYSFAAERTKKRALRRIYQARKYRLWKTLEILINHRLCPLSMDSLDRWRKYDRSLAHQNKGGRKYPISDASFMSWINLDFDCDGKPDYSSPYQLRAKLIESNIDLNITADRHQLGRAFYHIAQRRGFKSSRKDIVVDETGERTDAKSELKKETEFDILMKKKYGKSLVDFPTIGSALAFIETQGDRIRLDWIQHTSRKHYKSECNKIFEFQGISEDSELFKSLVETSRNRYNGSIFYQRPLRSQKGLVGICTLEQKHFKDLKTGKIIPFGKPRCPLSHPEFEEFRALSFLNNVQYKINGIWTRMSDDLKELVLLKLFYRTSKSYFHFIEIRQLLEKKLSIELAYYENIETNVERTINYSDKTNVAACPVSARLKDLFGEDWRNYTKKSEKTRINKAGETYNVAYTINDIWHVLFSFNDEEMVAEFAKTRLELNEECAKKFVAAWNACPEGYSNLSFNAIHKINRFLQEGLIYPEAVLLANIPKILGEKVWSERSNQSLIRENINNIIRINKLHKQLLSIVNNLIARYKSLPANEKYGYKDSSYILTQGNKQEILSDIIEAFGKKTWEISEKKLEVINIVTFLYQAMFRNDYPIINIGQNRYYVVEIEGARFCLSSTNQFYKMPRLVDSIKDFLITSFPQIKKSLLDELYHHSMMEIYPPAPCDKNDYKVYLQSPKTGAFKNPMAMRTLYELRKLINYLIKSSQINEETRIVVETARELNDANKRWAIEAYQKNRQIENREFADAIQGLLKNEAFTNPPNPESTDDLDKVRLWYEQLVLEPTYTGNGQYAQSKWTNQTNSLLKNLSQIKSILEKYRLWREQKCVCMYTGRIISISDLFDENRIDFEHTIPRSLSFDNSLANRTVCFADYNRNIKKNQIPTQLPNYERDFMEYTAIKPRLKAWDEKVNHIRLMIEFWTGKSKSASNKEFKDNAIKQRHLWRFELEYWKNKLDRFNMTEIKSGFRNSQLVDTQLISKYASHYLHTVFNTVEVQKGTVTSDFRKILGIQSAYEKKSRVKHSHHAIDSMILTLIPFSATRDRILKSFYELQELSKFKNESGNIEKISLIKMELQKEIRQLNLPDVIKIITAIDEEILINNVIRDHLFSSGKKIVRNRGRIEFLKDGDGNLLKDDTGKPKPKIKTGDCIRGQLHLDTYYGKIRLVERNEKDCPLRTEEGGWKFVDKNDGYAYVVRKLVTNIKSLEQIVDPGIRNAIVRQLNGRSIEKALEEGVFMLNKAGIPVGRPIRHIRCWADTSNPIQIKRQTYFSKTDYKNFYYAANAENSLYAYYWDGKSKQRDFICLNLFQVASMKKESKPLREEDYFPPSKIHGRGKTKIESPIYAVLKAGKKVLFFRESKEELQELNKSELLKRLYKIKRLYESTSGRIMFDYHLESRSDEELTKAFPKETFGQKGKNGFSDFNFEFPWPRLLMSISSFNFIVEGSGFIVKPDGEIQIHR